jgi:tRNA pseudouridine38-40 synthase
VDPPARGVLLEVQFDGAAFAGWQKQGALRTVQSELEKAVFKMVHHPVTTRSSSRTDAGVHAERLPVQFVTGRSIPCHGFVRGLSTLLPPDIGVLAARDVDPGFDPREAAVAKTYVYRLYTGPGRQPLLDRQAWLAPGHELDLEAMRAAARHFVGEHDFSAFRAVGCVSKTTRRTLHEVLVDREPRTGVIAITVTGNAFLQHMVRIMVGTLFEAGRGQRAPADIPAVLEGRDRKRAGQTAPARGLTLVEVHFEGYPRLGKRGTQVTQVDSN